MIKDAVTLGFIGMCSILPAAAAEQYSAINKAPPQSRSQQAEQTSAFNFALDGSVPFELDSNINRVQHNATADFHYSPFLKLSALTDLGPDLTYSIYADATVDRYIQYYNSNASTAGFGTQLKKQWDGLQLGAVYEWSQFFDRDFNESMGASNNIGGFLRYRYSSPGAQFRVKPSLSMMTRFDENFVVQRYLYYFKVDFEYEFVDRWSAIVTPRIRYFDYTGTQEGRRDMVYSISGGLRRRITQGLNFNTTVAYEHRDSNLAGKSYDDLTIGVSLDFSYTLLRSKSGARSDFLEWGSR